MTHLQPSNPDAEQLEQLDDLQSELVGALEAMGGSAGNASLRQIIGWDESVYETVRASLLAKGVLIPGRGRGGSIMIRSGKNALSDLGQSPARAKEKLMKERAPRNRTLTCTKAEMAALMPSFLHLAEPADAASIVDSIIQQDTFDAVKYLPDAFVDLLILDPPYNLSKDFNGHKFKAKEKHAYTEWFAALLSCLRPTLKEDATIYICSDWKTSSLIAPVLEEQFYVRNRITWEREKGRGAKANWKNNTEDIWFCTVGETFFFDVEAVKLKRKVIAPYRDAEGKPKDWDEGKAGNYRLTHPSNIWTDITIPFWSMPENTDHPTQKPEKLIAKLVLASSREDAFVFDPFLGSGTTAVVCKKLNRHYLGIEQNTEYCCWAQKRLERTMVDASIQGYADGVFWERNSLNDQKAEKTLVHIDEPTLNLFP